MVVDLPAGGRRLMQKARGYVATVKAGQDHLPERRGDRRAAGRAGAQPADGVTREWPEGRNECRARTTPPPALSRNATACST